MANTYKRIVLISPYGRQEELIAAGTVKPGYLVKRTSATQCNVHATEGGFAAKLFAVEDALQGNIITDSYSSADRVSIWRALPGDVINAVLKAGENVAAGDELISAGNGTLIKNGSEDSLTTVKEVIAIAREALNLSASSAVDTHIAVEVC